MKKENVKTKGVEAPNNVGELKLPVNFKFGALDINLYGKGETYRGAEDHKAFEGIARYYVRNSGDDEIASSRVRLNEQELEQIVAICDKAMARANSNQPQL